MLLDRSNGIVALLKILDQCCVLMIDQFIVYNQKISKLLFCNCLLELETIVFVTFRSVTNRISNISTIFILSKLLYLSSYISLCSQ